MAFDPSNKAHVATLKNELAVDEKSLGLPAADIQQKADLLNVPDQAKHGTVVVTSFAPVDAQRMVNPSEFAGLATGKQVAWSVLMGLGSIPNEAAFLDQVRDIWSSPSATLTALSNLKTRDGTRGETLYGVDTIMTKNDILIAMRS